MATAGGSRPFLSPRDCTTGSEGRGVEEREEKLVERKEGVDGLCHGVFLGFPSSLGASPPPVLAERRAVNGKLF